MWAIKEKFILNVCFPSMGRVFLFQTKQTPIFKVIIYLSGSQRKHSKTPLHRGTNGKHVPENPFNKLESVLNVSNLSLSNLVTHYVKLD